MEGYHKMTTSDFNKKLEEILTALEAYRDISPVEYRKLNKRQATTAIKTLIVELIGEDDHYTNLCDECNNWDEGRNNFRHHLKSLIEGEE
jgi:hypothetical protein